MKDKDKKGGKGGGISRTDLDLWKRFTGDIRPLKEPDWETLEQQAYDDSSDDIAPRERVVPPPPRRPDNNKHSHQPPQMDRRTQERLRKGQIPIEGRLDLHGYTQERAYDALQAFMNAAHKQGKRCLLVITGKGKSSINEDEWTFNDSVLRARLPEWVSTPPLSLITLKHFPAQPKHGGEGAYYIYLKKNAMRHSP